MLQPTQNRLLKGLSAADRGLLGPMDMVELPLRAPLERANEPRLFAHFIETGLASMVATDGDRSEAEMGVIGFEGMTGVGLIYRDNAGPFDTYMQIAGSAIRVEAARLIDAMGQSPTLNDKLLRYARAFALQTAGTAVTNARANVSERLSRWLLMVGDRNGTTFNITHEFISIMLVVRRAGVTLAIQDLEARRLIKATRGTITIKDRAGLVEASGGTYGLPEQEYERLLGR